MSANFKIYVWKHAPFLRLLVPLIAGILIGHYLPVEPVIIYTLGALSFLLFVAIDYLPLWLRFKYPQIRGGAITLLFLCIGTILIQINTIQYQEQWFAKHMNDSSVLQIRILKPPEEKPKSYKVHTEVLSVYDSGKITPTEGELILYLKKDSLSSTLQYGDEMFIRNKLKPIKNSGNPGAFDYAGYMAKRQIFHTAYLIPSDYFISAKNSKNPLQKFIFQIQDYVLVQIDTYISGTRERALTKALLIGYRLEVDNDLLQAYSNAGVVHLIAISGLHVAIIYGMLLFFASKVKFLRNRSVLKVVLILGFIWVFAFVTGASPSVLRASCMFSFISIGGLFKANTFIYNSLAASAFFLLIFDPYLLWNVGFQLSYLAVIGIVTTQKYIYNWLYVPNKIVDFVWQIASVSIAAQIFTLPVCLYYFHQFPMLFLFANILLIPIATLVLWGSVFLIIFSFIPVAAAFLGAILTHVVHFMNFIVLKIGDLSFSVWDMIYLQLHDMFLLYFIFIAIFFWLVYKNKTAFKFVLFFLLLLSVSFYADDWQKSRQRKMIIYNYPGAMAVDFLHGKRFFSKLDSTIYRDKRSFKFNILPARILYAAKTEARPKRMFEYTNILIIEGTHILVLDSSNIELQANQKPRFDYVLLTYNSPVNIREIAEKTQTTLFIFDASNSIYKINRWKKECEELHLQFHSVPDEGAFITEI